MYKVLNINPSEVTILQCIYQRNYKCFGCRTYLHTACGYIYKHKFSHLKFTGASYEYLK